MKKSTLGLIYRQLYSRFGAQHWWPGDGPFEVIIGAILTQNTNWANVERAINNLKARRMLSAPKMRAIASGRLASLIRSAGYYNIKAKRIKNFLGFFFNSYGSNLSKMRRRATPDLRQELLGVNGIGPETADSILLYALGKPVFVVDAYTQRVLLRHGLINKDAGYHQIQKLFTENLKNDVQLFNEYHALFVKVGKEYCLKRKPRCRLCPLK